MAAAPPQVASDLIPVLPLDRAQVIGRNSRDEGFEALNYDLHNVMENCNKEVRWTEKPATFAEDVTLTVPMASYARSSVRQLLKVMPYHRLSVSIGGYAEAPLISITLHRALGFVPATELIAGITQQAIVNGVPFLPMRDLIADYAEELDGMLEELKPEFEFTAAAAEGQTPSSLLEQFLINVDRQAVVLAWKIVIEESSQAAVIQVWQMYMSGGKGCPIPVRKEAPAAAPAPAPPVRVITSAPAPAPVQQQIAPAEPTTPPATASVVIFSNLKKRRQGDK